VQLAAIVVEMRAGVEMGREWMTYCLYVRSGASSWRAETLRDSLLEMVILSV
jgi:hypothetical protein